MSLRCTFSTLTIARFVSLIWMNLSPWSLIRLILLSGLNVFLNCLCVLLPLLALMMSIVLMLMLARFIFTKPMEVLMKKVKLILEALFALFRAVDKFRNRKGGSK